MPVLFQVSKAEPMLCALIRHEYNHVSVNRLWHCAIGKQACVCTFQTIEAMS